MIKPLVRIECKECSMFFKVPDIPAGLCAMRNAWTPADGGCMGSDDMKKTPDKVHVVRCKDCVSIQYCRFAQGLGLDGFCSKGERKNETD